MHRLTTLSLLCLMTPLAALAQESGQAASATTDLRAQAQKQANTVLILTPRSTRSAKKQAQDLSLGLQQAAKNLGLNIQTEAELAALTPGDIVARCPARISSSCLSQAAKKTGSRFVLTGQIEAHGEVLSVLFKALSADRDEIIALRDINFAPSRGDRLDMQLAGRCLGRSVLAEIGLAQADAGLSPCTSRVFASSATDRKYYQQSGQVPPAQNWITVLPAVEARQAYQKRNDMLAGSFASAAALAVVGVTAASFLLIQSRLTQGEILDFAAASPDNFTVRDGQVWVMDSASQEAARYRSLQSRERMETLTSMSAGLGALLAGVVALALYDQAEIPGRYEDYFISKQDPFARDQANADSKQAQNQ